MVTSRQSSPSTAVQATSAAIERLYVMLDGLRIRSGMDDCLIHVQGIHTAPTGDTWVQVALADDPAQGALMHLFPGTTDNQTIAALAVWAALPADDRPRSIDVVQAAQPLGVASDLSRRALELQAIRPSSTLPRSPRFH